MASGRRVHGIAVGLLALLAAAVPCPCADAAEGGGDRAQAGNKSESGKQGGDSRKNKDDEVDTENLFGFTEGAETGEKGEQEVYSDTFLRLGKRRAGPGRSGFTNANTRIAYQIDPTDSFSIEVSLFGDARRSRNVQDAATKANAVFDGGSLELKYQFLHGSDQQPLGLALETRPSYQRVLPVEGRGADIFDIETLIEADYRLVPDRLWYGTNVSYEPMVGRLYGTGETDRSSTLLWSHALVARVGEKTFLGPEIRYGRAYDGAFLNRFRGHAVTIGPVLYRKFSGGAYLTLAYAAQVAGHDRERDDPRRAFDLNHFERHAVRVKFGVEF